MKGGFVMYVNIKEIREEIGITQGKMAELLGISRYTVNLMEKPDKPYHINANRYYDLHSKLPEYIQLPEDFYNYTGLTVVLNSIIYGISIKDIHHIISNIYDPAILRGMFLYDKKEIIDKTFPDLYVPCTKDKNGSYKRFTNPALHNDTFNRSMLLNRSEYKEPLKRVDYLRMGGSKKDYDKYSVKNIKCNMFFNNVLQSELSEYLGVYQMKLSRWFAKEDMSLVMYAEELDKLFNPYIIPRIIK